MERWVPMVFFLRLGIDERVRMISYPAGKMGAGVRV